MTQTDELSPTEENLLMKVLDKLENQNNIAFPGVMQQRWFRDLLLLNGLIQRLNAKMKFTLGEKESPPDGCLKAGPTNNGFALRVRRRDKNGTVALISIIAGESIIFPSRAKLNRCLPTHQAEVEAYMSLVTDFGCDVDLDAQNAKPWLRLSSNLDAVIQELDELARCLQALADRPGAQ